MITALECQFGGPGRLRAAQASADDQDKEAHHRDHAKCNYIFHFVRVIRLWNLGARRLCAACAQGNPDRDDPSGRIGNRAAPS